MSVLIALGMLSLLVFIHEMGHYLAARWAGATVNDFSIGFGRALVQRTWLGHTWSLRLIPFGGFVSIKSELETGELTDDCLEAQSFFKRFIIYLAGPAMNLLGAIVILTALMNIGYRGNAEYLTDRYPIPEDALVLTDPALDTTGAVTHHMRVAPLQSVPLATELSVKAVPYMGYVVYTLIFTDKLDEQMPDAKMTGPVGIIAETSKATKEGFHELLFRAFSLSISLVIFNLIPFPPLDGGRILLMIPEAIFGRKRTQILQNITVITGGLAMIGLFAWVTIKDIIALF